ncbi:hypothetical protein D3C80_1445670 [compost metagenome]
MKAEKGYFGVEAVGKRVPFEYSKQLPALKDATVQAAVKTIRECIKLANEKVHLNQGWLDFEDGSPIWNKLQDFNEPLYMDYFQPFYFQTAQSDLSDSLPHHQLMAESIIVALLTWLDRSIK